jgi:dolichol-phosphate mannosyltransferase
MSVGSPLISVVIPVLNEAECLQPLFAELTRICDALADYRFEFLFVEGGSTDATPEVLAALRQRDERVCLVIQSRNFGFQEAISAGLLYASGEAVITMDADLQHPPAHIPQMLELWRAGYEVVNTVREETVDLPLVRRWCSALFYKGFNWFSGMQISPGSADFRLLARPVVDALNQMSERHLFFRGLIPWLGFRQTQIPFTAPRRHAGRGKFSFIRNLRFALDGITAFSFYPLRKVALFGWLVMLGSMFYGGYALIYHMAHRSSVPGWTSLLLTVLFLGGCQLLIMGVLGEYLGRVMEEVKGRPRYVVRRVERGSSDANDHCRAA